MATTDFTSDLEFTSLIHSINDEKCLLGDDDIVTINFSGTVTQTINARIANVPPSLQPAADMFFVAHNLTNKMPAGCYVRKNGTIIINDSVAGNNYWISVTYIR